MTQIASIRQIDSLNAALPPRKHFIGKLKSLIAATSAPLPKIEEN